MSRPVFQGLSPKVTRIFSLLRAGGATDVLIVGGFVRDLLLKQTSKDIDIEVYGLTYEKMARILRSQFQVNLVGRSFGVLKVDNEIDIALPRCESKKSAGHKGFNVASLPNLDPKTAFARRDFTINAIGMREDGTFFDPWHGIDDMEKKLLRAVGPAFKDDPLRVLRGMQFAARFGFSMDERTVQYCQEVRSEFPTLSEERIYEEWKKWALKGKYPERGLNVLKETGWIECFPELAAMAGCPQNPQWHPEGDVWTHTKNVCRQTARIIADLKGTEEAFSEEDALVLMFAALAHDFGKPITTKADENGVLRSHGHALAGIEPAARFLQKMRAPLIIIDKVIPLIREHMSAANPTYYENVSARMVRHLAHRLTPANIGLWARLCQADARGCFPENSDPDAKLIKFPVDLWLEYARQMKIAEKEPMPVLLGRDLLTLGFVPGPQMGALLKKAFQAQLDGEFDSKESALEWIRTRSASD